MTIEYKLEFRSCDIQWAADHDHMATFIGLWDYIPWNDNLTVVISSDEKSIKDQYNMLLGWEYSRSQPIKDVQIYIRNISPTECRLLDKTKK